MRLGEIQGIKINSEGYDPQDLETIWFVQEGTRNISLEKLQRKNYKISDALVKTGFVVSNQAQFDLDLKTLLEQIIQEESLPK